MPLSNARLSSLKDRMAAEAAEAEKVQSRIPKGTPPVKEKVAKKKKTK